MREPPALLHSWRALLLPCLTSAQAGDDAQLQDGGGAITLSNGLATAVIDKSRAQVVSIMLRGGHNLVTRGGITFDAEAIGGQGKREMGIAGGQPAIVSKGPETADIKFVDPHFTGFLTAEMHIVMRRGVPGVYEYLVMRHRDGQPAGSVGQLRWVFRGDGSLLTHAFASATNQGSMIRSEDFQGSRTIADATFALSSDSQYREPVGHTHDGQAVYSKYDWSDYVENHIVHGFTSENEGIFMVQPSMEYYNGGPSKAVLTAHAGPVSILEFLGGHFLTRDDISVHVTENQQWQQIIGPWLVYLNRGANADDLWRDAYRRATEEKTQWPYSWVQEDEALYPRKRGTVAGRLTLPGGPAVNALIVLAAPDKDWQVQTMGYEFWTRTGADGNFSLPKVRPGTYTLYASVPGVIGELKIPNVIATPGQTANLGAILWNPPHAQTLVWRLGTPNRSTSEFRFGAEPRQFGLWWQYLREMGTRELNYTIGKSNPAHDWYYAQSVIPMEDGTYFNPVWNILFNLDATPPGPMLLTVDLAGAAGGSNHLRVTVNGRPAGIIDSINDSGIYRSAVQSATFRHHEITFDSSLLKPGNNKVSFQLSSRANWRRNGAQSVIGTDISAMPEIPAAGVMYDCIQLEAGPESADGSYQVTPTPSH